MTQKISRLTAEKPTGRTAISNTNPRQNERQSLVDIEDLGKPPMFKGDARFAEWLRTTRFLIAVYGSAFRPVIEWVGDQDSAITNEALDRLFGPVGAEPIDDFLEENE